MIFEVVEREGCSIGDTLTHAHKKTVPASQPCHPTQPQKIHAMVMDEFLTVLEEIKEVQDGAGSANDELNAIETVVSQAADPIADSIDQRTKANPRFGTAVKTSFLQEQAYMPSKMRVNAICHLGRPAIYLASGRFCSHLFASDAVVDSACAVSLRIPFESVCAPKWATNVAGAMASQLKEPLPGAGQVFSGNGLVEVKANGYH